ncbi:uncharacterized protein LOC112346333 [Selaginella moellendorffii]|uniref:uncharacterized protein LOC112346333 n=1 Tax=Selaginella moellendorffii TaxID=88036 RepID=UPI000D1D09F9|nr:uncharacterized protein LOC112346333 [Selaginella moellendorffii]|eukprot:XP_024530834.1 uncharacterized protein LOC112346333 [Selaginella moellendorffii]
MQCCQGSSPRSSREWGEAGAAFSGRDEDLIGSSRAALFSHGESPGSCSGKFCFCATAIDKEEDESEKARRGALLLLCSLIRLPATGTRSMSPLFCESSATPSRTSYSFPREMVVPCRWNSSTGTHSSGKQRRSSTLTSSCCSRRSRGTSSE